jgi:hypothetical protein
MRSATPRGIETPLASKWASDEEAVEESGEVAGDVVSMAALIEERHGFDAGVIAPALAGRELGTASWR